MATKSPEACAGLRLLLRGLPPAIYGAVVGTNLQRSGCVSCGIGPHSTNECPVLGALAEEKAARLYRRWAALVGDELLVFSRSFSTQAYVDGAAVRLRNRNDLPKRRPHRMNASKPGNDSWPIPTRKPPVLTDPLLPDPPPPATHVPSLQPPKLAALSRRPILPSLPPPTILLSSTAASLPRQQPPVQQSSQMRARPKAAETPKSKERVVSPNTHSLPFHRDSSQKCGPFDHSDPTVSQDLCAMPLEDNWEENNVHLDAALLDSLSRLSQDVEMLRARVVGQRRSREFTPGSTGATRTKFVCVEDSPPPAPLNFNAEASSSSSSSASSSSSSSSASSSVSASSSASGSSSLSSPLSTSNTESETPSAEYETWDLDRYIKARHLSARQRFWQMASEAAKGRMVQALYGQPSGTPATIQARENGWIPL